MYAHTHSEEGQSPPTLDVTEDHPDVQKAVAAAVEKARSSPPEPTQENFVEALKAGVQKAEEMRREKDPQGQQ